MSLLNSFLNLIFPEKCRLCGGVLKEKEYFLCEGCLEELPWVKSYCIICGNPVRAPLTHIEIRGCTNCFKRSFFLDRVFVKFLYERPVSLWIREIKFKKNFVLAERLGRFLGRLFKFEMPYVDYVVCVPVSKFNKIKRGFNQSYFLAKGFTSEVKNAALLSNLFHKRKKVKSQVGLTYKERVVNVKNAFKIKENQKEIIKGNSFLLIDDVITTCSTLNEIAKLLKKEGASKVYGLAVATTGI